MNINAINNCNSSQQTFRGWNDRRFFKEITERSKFSKHYKEAILPEIKEKAINKAQFYGKPVRIAALDNNKFLVNVGTITRFIDGNEVNPATMSSIIENLARGNSVAEDYGIKKAEEFIKMYAPDVAEKTYRKLPRN